MNSEKLTKKRPIYVRSVVRFILVVFCSLITCHLSIITASAQDDPTDQAAPPLRTVTKEEKAQLNVVTDLKIHTKLALDLMNGRLTQAERLTTNSDFEGMFRELGGFHGLLDNTLEYLARQDQNNGKVLDNYKRFELALRTFTPRIETLRRDLPLSYEDYVRKLGQDVRDARSKAIDPQFGNSVVPVRKPDQP